MEETDTGRGRGVRSTDNTWTDQGSSDGVATSFLWGGDSPLVSPPYAVGVWTGTGPPQYALLEGAQDAPEERTIVTAADGVGIGKKPAARTDGVGQQVLAKGLTGVVGGLVEQQ